jgi:uncharacterized protein with von Willebrand factor type A (vWA) domain
MQVDFCELLKGTDLRSIGAANAVVKQINSKQLFDQLFACVFNADRLIAMRSIDAVEKVTQTQPHYLAPHKKAVLELLAQAEHKEAKWHLALLASRLKWMQNELGTVWQILTAWALNQKESRIVRVNALQALFDLLQQQPALVGDFHQTIQQVKIENIPSITARLKKLQFSPR